MSVVLIRTYGVVPAVFLGLEDCASKEVLMLPEAESSTDAVPKTTWSGVIAGILDFFPLDFFVSPNRSVVNFGLVFVSDPSWPASGFSFLSTDRNTGDMESEFSSFSYSSSRRALLVSSSALLASFSACLRSFLSRRSSSALDRLASTASLPFLPVLMNRVFCVISARNRKIAISRTAHVPTTPTVGVKNRISAPPITPPPAWYSLPRVK